MVKVTFMPQKITAHYPPGTKISAAAEAAGLPLDLVCGGRGRCGKCTVLVEEEGREAREVLACQEELTAHASVHIPARLLKKDAVILTGGTLGRVRLDPVIKKVFLPAAKLKEYESDGDFERLKLALEIHGLTPPSLQALRSLSARLRSRRGATAVIFQDILASLEEGDTTGDFYGLAVDIGTTTVAAYLYDLSTGSQVSVASALNRQNTVGADVMSRIDAAMTEEGLSRLHGLIMETLEGVLQEAAGEAGISPGQVYLVTLVGNSTMQHLFCRLSPYYLGRSPFTSTILHKLTLPAAELPLSLNPAGYVVFLPLIGGFVGADTTGVLLASKVRNSKKLRMVIDIGTNGEIVLGNRDRLLACSTAAGPALEGAGITFGMRGTDGAIEDLYIASDEVFLKTIGRQKAAGICGSGLVACLAEMLRVGMVKPNGRLLSREEFLAAGGSPKLASSLEEVEEQRVFRLTSAGKGIYISQGDIRAVQLAKGAISTGVNILMEELDISGDDVAEILLAGAFGNYIDVGKGQAMGLIPDLPRVPVRPVGNAAGAGAQKALLSRESLKEADRITAAVRHVELASHPKFQDRFIAALSFPDKEPS